jgi:peptidoglycan/xylan/chitin deacetylase (PgdA/CDA1 family)
MPRLTSPAGWRGLLFLLNAGLPLPTLYCLFTGCPVGSWLLGLTLVVHGLLLWGIMHPRSTWMGPLVSEFETTQNEVWVTIDDGPDGDRTRELSEQLRARGVRATFFLIGEKARRQPEILRLLQVHGHTIANHSFSHPRRSFWCTPPARLRTEVDATAVELRSLGVESALFRPPVGHKPPGLHRVLRERNLQLISWTVGGRDGWSDDPRRVVTGVLSKVKPGAIIVLHEARAHSQSTILAVVDALLARGYGFTIPSEEQLGVVTRSRAREVSLSTI